MNQSIMIPSIIYLDMDAVLADFDGPVNECFKLKNYTRKRLGKLQYEEWLILFDVFGADNFFYSLPILQDAKEQVQLLQKKYYNSTFKILTAIPRMFPNHYHSFVKQKNDWARDILETDIPVICTDSAWDKWKYGIPYSVLIDDNEKNVQLFNENNMRSGYNRSLGILFKNDWDEVNQCLEDTFLINFDKLNG